MNPVRLTPIIVLLSLGLTACTKSPGPTPVAPPPPTAESIAAAQVAQAAQVAYEERQARAVGFFSVTFKGITDAGYSMFTFTNLTGKDVDDRSGGFEGTDTDGNTLFVPGQTIGVPGEVFLKAGESIELSPYNLQEKEAPLNLLRTDPTSRQVVFRARSLSYLDGTVETELE